MIDAAGIRALEASGLRAVAASETIAADGWIVRVHGGPWRRANSVQTTVDPGPSADPGRDRASPAADLDARIDACEALYRARGRPPAFQLTPASQPPGLDARLEARGYVREAPTRVMTRSLEDAVPPGDGDGVRPPGTEAARAAVTLHPALVDTWLDALIGWEPRHAPARDRFRALLLRAGPEPRFAIASLDGRAVSVGLGVRDGAHLGLFDLATDPARRGLGLGSRVLDHLISWGRASGARLAWLQVEDANPRARDLYVRRGFADAYPYWYRVRAE